MTSLAAASVRSGAGRPACLLRRARSSRSSSGATPAPARSSSLLSLACFLPGFVSLQPMDRDEPRFAQASKQMLETGDFVDIRFQDEARHKKPVGIYWLQAAAVAAGEALGVPEARTTIALYRMPSLIGALATVLLTYWAALAFAGRREAFLAAAFMAASVILMVEARLAKTDAVLGACAVAAMGALARAYLARGAARLPLATVLVFWLAVALGILVKGPMVPMFAGLAVLALFFRERSARWLLRAAARPRRRSSCSRVVAALVRRDRGEERRRLLRGVGRARHARQGRHGADLSLGAARLLPPRLLRDLLAGRDPRRHRDPLRLGEPRATTASPSRSPGSCRPGSSSRSCRRSCRTTSCRSIRRSRSLTVLAIVARLRRGRRGRGAKLAALAASRSSRPAITVGARLRGKTLDGRLPWAGACRARCSRRLVALAGLVALRPRRARRARRSWRVAASPLLARRRLRPSPSRCCDRSQLSPRLAEIVRARSAAPTRAVGTLGYREPSLVFLVGTDLAHARRARARRRRSSTAGGCRLAFVERPLRGRLPAGDRARPGSRPALVARARRLQHQRRPPARDRRLCGPAVIEAERPPTRRR